VNKKNPTNQLKDIPAQKNAIHYAALGGLGEIGMNCGLFEHNGELLLVDCGQTMPDDDMLGVDYVIPDIEYLVAHGSQLKGIMLTHAHEDHIGALPYVLPRLPRVPVYASRLTIAMLREKLREHGVSPDFRELVPRTPVKVSDSFTVEPISVTHSIIDALALAIRTPVGVVMHSGDYKMDPHPPDGVAFDHYAFAKYAEDEDEGVLLLLGDSTNVERAGSCPSEIDVLPGLESIFREARKTLVISTFASSLHRIQNVLNLAHKHGRSVVAVGLNMERNIRIASKLGALEIPCDYHDDARSAKSIPREKRLILCTGSQGEPMASLTRMALETHRDISIEEGDTVVFSARIIPGNERPIYRLVNTLTRRGARVVTERDARIHVSGHAYRDDMKHLINLTNPRFVVPVHGEYRHLKLHCQLAMEQGLAEDEVFLLENGDCLELTKTAAKVIGKIPHGRVLVDGKGIGDVDEAVLRDRMHLSQDGMIVVILGIDHETGELLSGPEITMKGFAIGEDDEAAIAELREVVLDAYDEMGAESRTEATTLQAGIKRALRQAIKKRNFRFPMILPVVLEV
jgi:ribonuclease J